jgi:hypothetical protein
MLVSDTVFRQFSHDMSVMSVVGHPFCTALWVFFFFGGHPIACLLECPHQWFQLLVFFPLAMALRRVGSKSIAPCWFFDIVFWLHGRVESVLGHSYCTVLSGGEAHNRPMFVLDTVFRTFSHYKCVLPVWDHPFCAELDGGPNKSILLFYDIGVRLFSQDRNIIHVHESDH